MEEAEAVRHLPTTHAQPRTPNDRIRPTRWEVLSSAHEAGLPQMHATLAGTFLTC